MDKRIQKIYKDIDGWWIELKPGFIVRDEGTHGIIEDTKKAALSKMTLVVACDCAECSGLLAPAPAVLAEEPEWLCEYCGKQRPCACDEQPGGTLVE